MKNRNAEIKVIATLAIVITMLLTIPKPGSATTSHLVINEFYYDYQNPYEQAQWVEIYNPTENSVDISEWVLRFDKIKGVNVFPSGTTINGGAFLIVTRDIPTFQNLFSVPPSTQVFDDDAMLQNFVASQSDILKLVDTDSNVVDLLYYGGGSQAALFVAPPNSVARFRGGYDTDQCWVDFYTEIVPTPGRENAREYGVGGIVISVDKLALLAPYIGLASATLIATVATAAYVKHVRHRREKQ